MPPGARNLRALTDMTAAYAPLRDLGHIPEEVHVVFETTERTAYRGIVCVSSDTTGVAKVTLWIQGTTELHDVVFDAGCFLWCRKNATEILFWKLPVRIDDVALRFRFERSIDAENFLRRVYVRNHA